jgi:hypothetical protein|eukprot:SAG25_NODE_24_length_22161_cov_23.692405_8_plen_88_part_00
MHHVLLITLAVVVRFDCSTFSTRPSTLIWLPQICGPICCAVYIADPGEADEYLSEKSRRQYRAKRRREMQETVAQLVAQDNVKAKEH